MSCRSCLKVLTVALVAHGCTSPIALGNLPIPGGSPAPSLADAAIQPLANAMIMAGQAVGQMVANSTRAAGVQAMIPNMPFATTQFPGSDAFTLPSGVPFAIPSGLPFAIPSGLTLPGISPAGVPAASPWSQYWNYRDGWYWSQFNSGDRQLRFRFERADGSTVDWDVTAPGNYGPPPKPGRFPADLVKFHTEYANRYPLGVAVSATCYGAIPPAPPTAATRIPQTGHGQVRNVPVLGTIDFTVEADANGAATDVKGKVVHKVQYQGKAYTGESGLQLDGPTPPATITREGETVAELSKDAKSGQWQITAEGKTIPVDAPSIPGLPLP